MILTSLVLVVVSAISLLVGGLFRDDLPLIYLSIASALAAGLFLLLGVMRGGRRPKPVKASAPVGGSDGPSATWKGAGWASSDEGVLPRDADAAPPAPAAPEPTPVTSSAPEAITESLQSPPASPAPAPAAAKPTSPWAPPPPPPGPRADAPPATPPAKSGPPPGTPPPPPPPPG